jgi:hypothetical protein
LGVVEGFVVIHNLVWRGEKMGRCDEKRENEKRERKKIQKEIKKYQSKI